MVLSVPTLDFARAISGCWQVEHPEKLQPEFEKYLEIIGEDPKLYPKITNKSISILATVDDNQKMNVNIHVKLMMNMVTLNITIRGKADNQTMGEKIMTKLDGNTTTSPVIFGYKDNLLTAHVISPNNTDSSKDIEMFRWSIDENWLKLKSSISLIIILRNTNS